MMGIEFSEQERDVLRKKLQVYFSEELDQELGRFEAEALLEFFASEVGSYAYNRALYDTQAVLQRKVGDISDAIFELEKVTKHSR